MANFENIKRRFDRAVSARTPWNDTYARAAEFSMPERSDFQQTRTPGQPLNGPPHIYDSSGVAGLDKGVANLQDSIVPSNKRFLKLNVGEALRKQESASALQEALDGITNVAFGYIWSSNFDTQVSEAFYDLFLGTGAMLIRQGPVGEPVIFTTIPITELYLEAGPNNSVGATFRKHKVPFQDLEKTWPDISIPTEIEEKYESKPEEPLQLVEVVTPGKVKVLVEDRQVEVDGYTHEVYDAAFNHRMLSVQMRSTPWVVFRWSVTPGETWGRGPLLKAAPDLATLNKTKELILQNASMAVAGAYTVADDGVTNISNIKIRPGALIAVAGNEGSPQGRTIDVLPRAGDFNVAQLVINDLRASVNDILMTEPFGPIDLPVKSATEIALRQQALVKRIGSAFGRLQREFVSRMFERVLFLLDEQGLIDLAGFRIDGQAIDIEYTSPLAQAQKEEDIMTLMRYAATLQQVLPPEALPLILDPVKFSTFLAEKMGVPAEVLTNPETREQLTQLAMNVAQAQGGGGGGPVA